MLSFCWHYPDLINFSYGGSGGGDGALLCIKTARLYLLWQELCSQSLVVQHASTLLHLKQVSCMMVWVQRCVWCAL